RITLVSSALTGEGKSTIAALIARSTAYKLNTPTLLIDFDVRRPTLHNIFQVRREKGLVDVLNLNLTIRNCLKQTSVPNLALLTSGKTDVDPNELLKSDKIKVFLKGMGTYFHNIIIDSPPVIPVSDPLILAKLVDHIVLVLKAGHTPRSIVKRAIDMFADVNVQVTGLVMNNMQNVMPYQYDYRYYGYKYTPNGN
ncbi:MAG: CpsD/CapB family tyrosine-protein kinase, partial [Calditrichaeota bacterium]|nr:CpsD/CapB family tyrosine-protein kinase [Calditrichota bacterium]